MLKWKIKRDPNFEQLHFASSQFSTQAAIRI